MQGVRETTFTFFFMYLSPLKSKSCEGHGRYMYLVKKKCCCQEGQLLLYVLISPETKILCRP